MPRGPRHLQRATAAKSSAGQGERPGGSPPASGATRFLQAGEGWSPKEPVRSRGCAEAGQGAGSGRAGPRAGWWERRRSPQAFLRPSKSRRLPRVPAAPLGDLALHEPHKLASTTPLALGSGFRCPHAASPETQKPTKDAGLIKRHFFLSSALVSNQFPPVMFTLKRVP